MREADKAQAIGKLSKTASTKYSTILTRYPLMDRAVDAKKRLEALHEPVPRATTGAVARNKAEIESRGQATMMQRAMGLIKKGPDVSQATAVGEPTLVEAEPISAVTVQQEEAKDFMRSAGAGGGNKVGVEIVKPDQPVPSGAPPTGNEVNPNAPFGTPPAAAPPGTPATPDPNELKPDAPPDPNELKPADSGTDTSLPPPNQVNEIQNQSSSSSSAKADDSTPASDQDLSSSKRKKKKGLKKINPF
jgi:outer membrane protein assembly factor BamD